MFSTDFLKGKTLLSDLNDNKTIVFFMIFMICKYDHMPHDETFILKSEEKIMKVFFEKINK